MALDNLFSEGMLEGYRVKVTGAIDSTIYSYRIKNLDRFDFYGYVSDDELAQLYHDAYSLIYMSNSSNNSYNSSSAIFSKKSSSSKSSKAL